MIIKNKQKENKRNEKNGWKPWGCIYIYIYIVNFRENIIRKLNRINQKHRLFCCKIAYAFDTS